MGRRHEQTSTGAGFQLFVVGGRTDLYRLPNGVVPWQRLGRGRTGNSSWATGAESGRAPGLHWRDRTMKTYFDH